MPVDRLPPNKDKRTHSWRRNTTYHIWYGVVQRCYNMDHTAYWEYGGRGINVQETWLYPPYTESLRLKLEAFANFVNDVGLRPSQHVSLDRKDPNGHYEKDNVRWATLQTQARNKRKSIFVPDPADPTKLIPAAELAERMKISYQQLRYRLKSLNQWPGDT